MKVPRWVLIVFTWVVLGISSYPMNLACTQQRYKRYHNCRQDRAFYVGWGMVSGPIGLAMTPFLTGFAEHGFQFSCPAEGEKGIDHE